MKLAVIAGDGIGPEVVAEALQGPRRGAAGRRDRPITTWVPRRYHATGELLPDSVLDELRGHDAILLGAIGDPSVPSGVLERGLLLRLRFELDHHVNLRPVAAVPGREQPARGKSGDRLRGGARGDRRPLHRHRRRDPRRHPARGGHRGQPEHRVRRRAGRARCVRARAATRRKHLTLVHKTNVLTFAGKLWSRIVAEVGDGVPRRRQSPTSTSTPPPSSWSPTRAAST